MPEEQQNNSSPVVSLCLRTCWWTTRWRSLQPTCTRPSARRRNCRNSRLQNDGEMERKKKRGRKRDVSPGLGSVPLFLNLSPPNACRLFTLKLHGSLNWWRDVSSGAASWELESYLTQIVYDLAGRGEGSVTTELVSALSLRWRQQWVFSVCPCFQLFSAEDE